MQNTRLNNLFDALAERLGGWLRNPWRRLSVLIISLLLGYFLSSAVSTISGQAASADVLIAGILVVGIEFVSRLAYGSKPESARSLPIQILNAMKIGLTYGLVVEAFKLGS